LDLQQLVVVEEEITRLVVQDKQAETEDLVVEVDLLTLLGMAVDQRRKLLQLVQQVTVMLVEQAVQEAVHYMLVAVVAVLVVQAALQEQVQELVDMAELVQHLVYLEQVYIMEVVEAAQFIPMALLEEMAD
jgi:hypothetical protein